MIIDSEMLVGKACGQTWFRENRTENYVCIPPALIITDYNGATWTFGNEYLNLGWAYYINVLRNDVDTGEFAARIEYHRGRVRIWTQQGWKVWTERPKGSASSAPGYFV